MRKNARVVYKTAKYTARGIRGARAIQKAWRKRKVRKINRRVDGNKGGGGKTTGTRVNTDWLPGNFSTNSLLFRRIKFPEGNSTNYTGRLGQSIRMKGIHVCDMIINHLTYPIEVHWALCQEKHKDVADLETDFFRDTTNTTDRSSNFESGTTPWDQKYTCFRINPDKWNIVTHKRRVLDPKKNSDTYIQNLSEVRWRWKIDKFFPLKQRVVFDSSAATEPTKPYIVFMWWQAVDVADANLLDNQVSIASFDQVYFKNGAS